MNTGGQRAVCINLLPFLLLLPLLFLLRIITSLSFATSTYFSILSKLSPIHVKFFSIQILIFFFLESILGLQFLKLVLFHWSAFSSNICVLDVLCLSSVYHFVSDSFQLFSLFLLSWLIFLLFSIFSVESELSSYNSVFNSEMILSFSSISLLHVTISSFPFSTSFLFWDFQFPDLRFFSYFFKRLFNDNQFALEVVLQFSFELWLFLEGAFYSFHWKGFILNFCFLLIVNFYACYLSFSSHS